MSAANIVRCPDRISNFVLNERVLNACPLVRGVGIWACRLPVVNIYERSRCRSWRLGNYLLGIQNRTHFWTPKSLRWVAERIGPFPVDVSNDWRPAMHGALASKSASTKHNQPQTKHGHDNPHHSKHSCNFASVLEEPGRSKYMYFDCVEGIGSLTNHWHRLIFPRLAWDPGFGRVHLDS